MSAKSHLLISTTPETRQRFKDWCHSQGISMNRAFTILMQQMTNGSSYKLKEAFLRRAKKS